MTEIAPHAQDFIDAHLGTDAEVVVRGRITDHQVLADGRIKFAVAEVLRDEAGEETGVGEIVGFIIGTVPPTAEEVEAQLAAQAAEEQRLLQEREDEQQRLIDEEVARFRLENDEPAPEVAPEGDAVAEPVTET